MSKQQAILRVETTKIDKTIQTSGTFDVGFNYDMTVSGSGTTTNPYQLGVIDSLTDYATGYFPISGGQGFVNYSISGHSDTLSAIAIGYNNDPVYHVIKEEYGEFSGTINVNSGDYIYLVLHGLNSVATMYYDNTPITSYKYLNLDLYSDIPIKITKSFSEMQDISKKNSDLSIGLLLPGTKTNNSFFENFFDVNVGLLNFDPTKRVPCSVIIDDAKFFSGYLKLNKINVKDSLKEYDVTLYSTIGNIFGLIGNNLLKDLDFGDPYHRFNHTFDTTNVMASWNRSNFTSYFTPLEYIYPIIHNGYEYSGDTINFTGGTSNSQSRFYTSTSPIGSYDDLNAFYTAGGLKYRINSQQSGLVNNQLKPALSLWHLVQLIFKTYGYTIQSDFFNTPWFKTLYTYGFYNTDTSKFTYKLQPTEVTLSNDAEFILTYNYMWYTYPECNEYYLYLETTMTAHLVKKGTGVPTFLTEDISIPLDFTYIPCPSESPYSTIKTIVIPAGSTSGTLTFVSNNFKNCTGCPLSRADYFDYVGVNSTSPINESKKTLQPISVADDGNIMVIDNMFIDFRNVVDEQYKQIDLLSSIAKKFDLVFIQDPEVPNNIIIEPYSYFIGTGNVYDWTDKLSYDKGFTIEPAINYIESILNLSDSEDGDAGNIEFKNRNNRIYGQKIVNSPTDFKSDEKKIETIFSPMVMRKWDADGQNNVDLPLGISYSSNSKEIDDGDNKTIFNYYSGVKTKLKLFYWLGSFNPFINNMNEIYDHTKPIKSYQIHIRNSENGLEQHSDTIPVISHSMSLGNRYSTDTCSILFKSEIPTYIDVETFNTYTPNDCYNLYYKNRIDNLYNKDTRFLSGYFNLKLSDISNLKPEDIIKIGEKYFTWNKITDFNYMDNELTKVELIQFNNSHKEYPVRYFKYYYCGNTGVTYNIKTDFTNPDMMSTNYYFSLQYDYNMGMLTGATGYTSSFLTTGNTYLPYYIYEVTEDEYNASGIPFVYDSYLKGLSGFTDTFFYLTSPVYWKGTSMTGVNLFTSCDDFSTKASTYGIPVASAPTPLPTPTPVPTTTPVPTPTIKPISGSLLINIDM